MSVFSQSSAEYQGTTVISEGVKVEGNFKGEGDMVIDGSVHGTIGTTKSVQVGGAAHIEANIRAASAIVSGYIKGNINAKDRVELLAGSYVEGDITTKNLIISEGAAFNGKCNMGSVQHPSKLAAEEQKQKEKTASTKTKAKSKSKSTN